ncbi:hypothetical protein LE181_04355 [Streptomyces sp. SCA3-4]|uniref:hypothetical protein n=1 Tax=Streptomyces sichuanensis TaxID=2871810 RepID=UPI001CE2AD6D|nr:hypothetical protein [Streptomyces sichuanensis]MCA6091404.1 hypothetical protein [Streptomyces sichuanensis]
MNVCAQAARLRKCIPMTVALVLGATMGIVPASATTQGRLGMPTSVCQPNGTGCTKAGSYYTYQQIYKGNPGGPGGSIPGGPLEVTWTSTYVYPYTSGVPLYWRVGVTYHNDGDTVLYFGCYGGWPTAGYVQEHMVGGSGNNGTVSAESTLCSQNPNWVATLGPGREFTLWAIFHNVPWPGSKVAITWGNYGSSPYIDPFVSPLATAG